MSVMTIETALGNVLRDESRESLWKRLLAELRTVATKAFDIYEVGKNLKLESVTDTKITFTVPSESVKGAVETFFKDYLETFWRKVYPKLAKVVIDVRDATRGRFQSDNGLQLTRPEAQRVHLDTLAYSVGLAHAPKAVAPRTGTAPMAKRDDWPKDPTMKPGPTKKLHSKGGWTGNERE